MQEKLKNLQNQASAIPPFIIKDLIINAKTKKLLAC